MSEHITTAVKYDNGILQVTTLDDNGYTHQYDTYPLPGVQWPDTKFYMGALVFDYVKNGGIIVKLPSNMYTVPNFVNRFKPVIQVNPNGVQEEISKRQFYQQAVIDGEITQQEALDAMRGIIPIALAYIISELDSDQQYAATMALFGESFYRHSDFTVLFGYKINKSSSQLDDFWQAASLL